MLVFWSFVVLLLSTAGQTVIIARACVLPLYMPDQVESIVEADFLVDVLLSQIPHTCGCHLKFRKRSEFVTDLPVCSILLAVWGVTAEEEVALQHLQGTVLLHLSDENLSASTSSYNNTAAVFRQYLTHEGSMNYLTYTDATHVHQHVHWIPLGYGKFKVAPPMYLAFSERPWLWTWIGSKNHKPERGEMLEQLTSASLQYPEIKQNGFLHTYGEFVGEGTMGMHEYSYHMYATKFVPLPSGGSPEQYRLWEAFEAGVFLFLSYYLASDTSNCCNEYTMEICLEDAALVAILS